MSKEEPKDRKVVQVELADAQWVVVLAILDGFIKDRLEPKLEKLRKLGTLPSDISPENRTALAGPLIARGVIVKALHEAGVMKPEANDALGIDALMKRAQKYLDGQN